MTTKDASKLWGISTRRITTLCNEDRVDGAVFMAHAWLIPKNTTKPKELKSGKKNKEKKSDK